MKNIIHCFSQYFPVYSWFFSVTVNITITTYINVLELMLWIETWSIESQLKLAANVAVKLNITTVW